LVFIIISLYFLLKKVYENNESDFSQNIQEGKFLLKNFERF